MGAETVILAALIGAALMLDEYVIFMSLISQPIISGGIAGIIFGDVQTGIMIGAIVQLIWIMPPVGAYVPPSPSAIAFSAAGIGIMAGNILPVEEKHALLMFALIAGASFGYFTGQMNIWNRKLNTLIMRAFEKKVEEGRTGYLYAIQGLAVLLRYLRDVIGYLAVFALGLPLFLKIYMTMPAQVVSGLKIAFWVAPMIGFAVLFDMFHTKKGALFHGPVLVLSYLLLSVYRVNIAYFFPALLAAGILIVYDQVWSKGGRRA